MSELLYTRISTQNIACSHRQMHKGIHLSVIHYEHATHRETDRQTDRQRQAERERDRERGCGACTRSAVIIVCLSCVFVVVGLLACGCFVFVLLFVAVFFSSFYSPFLLSSSVSVSSSS